MKIRPLIAAFLPLDECRFERSMLEGWTRPPTLSATPTRPPWSGSLRAQDVQIVPGTTGERATSQTGRLHSREKTRPAVPTDMVPLAERRRAFLCRDDCCVLVDLVAARVERNRQVSPAVRPQDTPYLRHGGDVVHDVLEDVEHRTTSKDSSAASMFVSSTTQSARPGVMSPVTYSRLLRLRSTGSRLLSGATCSTRRGARSRFVSRFQTSIACLCRSRLPHRGHLAPRRPRKLKNLEYRSSQTAQYASPPL